MKLRLPHKLQAALIATLASAAFTTLSTGTIAVATGAALLAGQQAQAVEVQNSETLATKKSLAEATGDAITLSGMTYTNSAGNSNQKSFSNDVFSPDIKINGNDAWWTLTFTLTNTTDHAITLDSLLLDMTMYNAGGGNQNPPTYRSTKLTLTQDTTSASPIQLYQQDIVLSSVDDSRLNGSYLYENSQVTDKKPVLTLGEGIELDRGESATFTLKAQRSDIRSGIANVDGGCYFGLKDMVVNYSYEGAGIPTWNGSDGHANWSDETAWSNGIPTAATPAIFDAAATVKTVNVDTTGVAGAVTVSGQGYTFSLQAGGNLTANSLTINGDATGLTIDSAEGATGTLKVNSAISASGKTITVNNGAVLQVATTGSSFTLAGNGTYALGDGVYAKDNGVTIGSNWTGTVLVSNTNASQNNQVNDVALTNGNQSTLELSGFKGWLANDRWKKEVATNIKLTDYVNGSSTRYAWVSEAYSTGSTDTMTLTGKWSGTGTYNAAGTNGGTRYMHYNFKGDITDWTGAFLKTSQNTIHTNLTFSENAKNVNIRIDGSGNFGVIVDTDATFSKAVAADTFTVNEGKSATLTGTGSLNAGTITIAQGASLAYTTANSVTGTLAGAGTYILPSGTKAPGNATIGSGWTGTVRLVNVSDFPAAI